MARLPKNTGKPRPTKVYRVERRGEWIITSFKGETRGPRNSTEQYFNKPDWWPGPETRTVKVSHWEGTVTYLEGTISWDDV